MLHSHCRHLLAAGLDNGTITLYTWKHTADKSSGWVLLAELDQRYETNNTSFDVLKENITLSIRLITSGSVYGCSR